jgi:hypothetical protein
LKFTCPVSNLPYICSPNGLPLPTQPGHTIIMYDAQPSHDGKRWAIVGEESAPGQPLVTRVVLLSEAVFNTQPTTQPILAPR